MSFLAEQASKKFRAPDTHRRYSLDWLINIRCIQCLNAETFSDSAKSGTKQKNQLSWQNAYFSRLVEPPSRNKSQRIRFHAVQSKRLTVRMNERLKKHWHCQNDRFSYANKLWWVISLGKTRIPCTDIPENFHSQFYYLRFTAMQHKLWV